MTDGCNVWRALAVLPPGLYKAKVCYKYAREEIKYEEDRTQTLMGKKGGCHSFTCVGLLGLLNLNLIRI